MERVRRSRTELHRRGTAAGRRGGGARIVPGPVAGTSDEISHRAGPGGRLPSPRSPELERWRLRSLDGGSCLPPLPVDLARVGGWVVVQRRPGACAVELASATWGEGAVPHGRRSRAGVDIAGGPEAGPRPQAPRRTPRPCRVEGA